MKTAEYDAMKQTAKGLEDEEKQVVLKTVSNEMLLGEVSKRLINMTDKVKQIREILKISED